MNVIFNITFVVSLHGTTTISTHFLWLVVISGALQNLNVQRARVVEFLLSPVGLS